jgi:K+/H+ antiporter YhaU regulatory subunit KhtT
VGGSRLHDRFGIFVLAVRHGDGSIESKPAAETRLVAGDHIVVLGTGGQFSEIARLV